MRIFIAGATGVIGRRVVPLLVQEGHKVTAMVRSAQQRVELERAGASARRVSLFDEEGLAAAVSGHHAVINLATHIPIPTARMLLPSAWRENDRLRRDGSAALVDAAIGGAAERFIQESFAPTYADHGDAWISEDEPLCPARYSRTVVDAESSARRFGETGRAAVVLRFAAFYGPDASQLEEMIGLIRRGWAVLPGRADSFISSVAHDDAAAAVVAALQLPPGTYNVADDEPLRHREFVDALADAVGAGHPRLPPAWMAVLAGSPGRMMARSQRISNQKLRAASGWAPRYPSVREGFPATVAAAPEARA